MVFVKCLEKIGIPNNAKNIDNGTYWTQSTQIVRKTELRKVLRERLPLRNLNMPILTLAD